MSLKVRQGMAGVRQARAACLVRSVPWHSALSVHKARLLILGWAPEQLGSPHSRPNKIEKENVVQLGEGPVGPRPKQVCWLVSPTTCKLDNTPGRVHPRLISP